MMRAWLIRLLVLPGLLSVAVPIRAWAQAYGSQNPLSFQFTGQSDQTRLQIEAERLALSNQVSGANSGSVGASSSLGQSGTNLNNVVQYYNYATTNVSVTGSNNAITTGGVLNASQTSSGSNQILNNQTGSAASTTSGVLQQ